MRTWALRAVVLLVACALAACQEGSAATVEPMLAAAIEATPSPSVVGPEDPGPRADEDLDRAGQTRIRATVKGPLLSIPRGFASADGQYDLLIAFHTHRPVLREVVDASGINAVLVNVNLGVGAGNYEKVFSAEAAFQKLLENVGPALRKRGLRRPRLRRVALVSWSAGYGAIVRILSQPANAARVDSVVILDGMHAHLVGDSDQIDEIDVKPYEAFARRAARGEALFIATHNHIVPEDKIASVTRVTDLVLERLGIERRATTGTIEAPTLAANDGVYSRRRSFDLTAETVAQQGQFIVRGFEGRKRNDHVCHLMNLEALALRPIVERWTAGAFAR